MRSRRLRLATLGLVTAGALAAGASVLAAALGGGSGSAVPPGLDRVSNQGSPLDLAGVPASERRTLDVAGVAGSMRALGRAGAVAVYTGRGPGGVVCYIAGSSAGGPRFGSVLCPDPSAPPAFPSADMPLLDLSTYAVKEGTDEVRLVEAAGVAADGVARVGFVGADGDTLWLPVTRNLYGRRDVGPREVTSVVAVDRAGSPVHTRSLRLSG